MITVNELTTIEYPVVICTEGFQKVFHNFEQVCEFFDEELAKNNVENEDTTKFFTDLLKTLYIENLYTYQKQEFFKKMDELHEKSNYIFKLYGSGYNYEDVKSEIGKLYWYGSLYNEDSKTNNENYFEEFLNNEFSIDFDGWISENFISFHDVEDFIQFIITEKVRSCSKKST